MNLFCSIKQRAYNTGELVLDDPCHDPMKTFTWAQEEPNFLPSCPPPHPCNVK